MALSLAQGEFTAIKLVATDMDGTLTKQGKFTSELLAALETLQKSGILVLIVTGRSAGWVSAVANYLPVVGAIAENGGLFYHNQKQTTEFMEDLGDIKVYRQKLQQVFQLLQTHFPRIQESADNPFRLTDWTFDIGDLTIPELSKMTDLCQEQGFGFTYSTVQCHIKPLNQNKATALQQVLANHFPNLDPTQVVTVGDSPNDESLFNNQLFPCSVGVANISHYCDRLIHQPTYITASAEVAGFRELVAKLVAR